MKKHIIMNKNQYILDNTETAYCFDHLPENWKHVSPVCKLDYGLQINADREAEMR